MEFILAYIGPKLAAKILIPLIGKLLLKLGLGAPAVNAVSAVLPDAIASILGKAGEGHPLTEDEKKRLQAYRMRDDILKGRSGMG